MCTKSAVISLLKSYMHASDAKTQASVSMATPNRNPWLDAHPSEDEDAEDHEQGYDSEAAEERRPTHRAAKRRRLSPTLDAQSDISSDDEETVASSAKRRRASQLKDGATDFNTEGHTTTSTNDARFDLSSLKSPHMVEKPSTTTASQDPTKSKPKQKPLTKKALKPGILYISRVPPYMRPSTLRTLLTPYAPKHGLNRLFLTPEPSTSHSLRVRHHGNKKRSYIDGWIEFRSKREAKRACELLNCQIIGGKKGGYYRDDVWNLRYLRGFAWERDLVGAVAGEMRERGARVEEGMRRQRGEDRRFVESVEDERQRRGMERKRQGKRMARLEERGEAGVENEGSGGGGSGNEASLSPPEEKTSAEKKDRGQRFTTHFKQNKVIHEATRDRSTPAEDVQRVLSKIF